MLLNHLILMFSEDNDNKTILFDQMYQVYEGT